MTDRNDKAYFEKRAREERVMASTCEDNSAALAHLRMADEYDRRVQGSTGSDASRGASGWSVRRTG